MAKQYLEAGKAVTTHGIHGEVKVYPWSDSPQVLCKLKKLFLDDRGSRALEVVSARAEAGQGAAPISSIATTLTPTPIQ